MASFYTRCLQDLPKMSISDVHRLVRMGSSTPKSKREKGYKMYLSSYIDNYEVSNKDPAGRVSIRAVCYRSMRKHEKPHDLRVGRKSVLTHLFMSDSGVFMWLDLMTFENSSPVQIAVAECSCVAGTALCNHNVALLYQTAHYSTLNLKAVPPVLSCTETEQQWHKPRTMVDEAYKDFTADIAPLITTMAISSDVPLVDSAYGPVQEGSPISYQHPVPLSRVVVRHQDTPTPPAMPLDGYRLDPTTCNFVCSHQQQNQLMSLAITLDMARKVEVATREQSNSVEWYHVRKPRLTSSRFREVCHVRGHSSAENLAERIRKGGVQTALMKRGLALEPVAIQEYSRIQNVSYWPCGFVIHPDAPWLGSSPDGVVFDPTESPPFGLVEIKCPNVKSYVDCSYMQMQSGTLKLKHSHSYYWQVQGQLLLTGMEWCDFIVFAEEDILIQRIHRDPEVARVIRERGDYFFFYFYLG
ncbi:hypothetical protein N1851_034070 [Merluccius polli]|uniref:SWIM-type domain-containing protein n=1 Tax=Merluccius polli TaxID=89951 RepID=A0AA47M088_MERPO|nr:hypothetical protein N1851_034070 [Merluccius polli]